jgi:hypothetical protein
MERKKVLKTEVKEEKSVVFKKMPKKSFETVALKMKQRDLGPSL